MGIESSILDICEVCGNLDKAVSRVADVWDDQVSANIQTQCINEITSCARDAVQELSELSQRIHWDMDYIVSLTY